LPISLNVKKLKSLQLTSFSWPGALPWTPLGAPPTDLRYRLALRARHGSVLDTLNLKIGPGTSFSCYIVFTVVSRHRDHFEFHLAVIHSKALSTLSQKSETVATVSLFCDNVDRA